MGRKNSTITGAQCFEKKIGHQPLQQIFKNCFRKAHRADSKRNKSNSSRDARRRRKNERNVPFTNEMMADDIEIYSTDIEERKISLAAVTFREIAGGGESIKFSSESSEHIPSLLYPDFAQRPFFI